MAGADISEPFPIFKVADNYLLYDVDVISHVRQNYNICGVLTGTLPQVPQQSVFLGIPMLLMPEEARILVEERHACIVDDAEAHRSAFLAGGLGDAERLAFARALEAQGLEAAAAVQQRASERKEQALKRVAMGKRAQRQPSEDTNVTSSTEDSGADTSLFSAASEAEDTASTVSVGTTPQRPEPFYITPTTSYPPLQHVPTQNTAALPPVPPSYPLFAYLHRKGYFMTPGLRFGCQYTAYPGDPLRFHSHFLAVGRRWDEEFRMIEIVGGGRLGTGVKKGFMIGGQAEDGNADEGKDVRAFCFEWAGM